MDKLDLRTISPVMRGNYSIDVHICDIEQVLGGAYNNPETNPVWQRGHVWTEKQQVRFIEFILRQGKVPSLKFNTSDAVKWVLVDGKQRLSAIRLFNENKIKVFGGFTLENIKYIHESCRVSFLFNDLKTNKEVVDWYIQMNENSVAHTDAEIQTAINYRNTLI